MKITHLIDHYRQVKSQHEVIHASLDDKLTRINLAFGAMPASSTGVEIVLAAKSAWPGRAPGTIKRYLVQLRAVMRRAEKEGLIDKAPVIDVPYVYDTVYVDITAAEVNLLLDYLRWIEPQWYPLILVLAHTGARLGEALALTPASFLPHGTRIIKTVGRKSKTVDRVIPYTSRMRQAMQSGMLPRPRLYPSHIQPQSVAVCLGRVIDTATKALGLPALRVHDLRHAFAAVLAEHGADLADLSTALGHTNQAMSLRYRGLVKGKLSGIMSGI